MTQNSDMSSEFFWENNLCPITHLARYLFVSDFDDSEVKAMWNQ